MSEEGTQVLEILKGLQTAARLQQSQIDKLIEVYETSLTSNSSLKRPASSMLNDSIGENDTTAEKPVKDLHDKILDNPKLLKAWSSIMVSMDVTYPAAISDEQKAKIEAILKNSCRLSKIVVSNNFKSYLGEKYKIKDKTDDSVKHSMEVGVNISNGDIIRKDITYAHNPESFLRAKSEFQFVLMDPVAAFREKPVESLLVDSCFSYSHVPRYRQKRQRLPVAIVCVKKPGFLSFFVADWAFQENADPSINYLSNMVHYTTLHLRSFASHEELDTEHWKSLEESLQKAACPTDFNIGSVTGFLHENRGNMICAKVIRDSHTDSPALRIYSHTSCRDHLVKSGSHFLLHFNDSGADYMSRLCDTKL